MDKQPSDSTYFPIEVSDENLFPGSKFSSIELQYIFHTDLLGISHRPDWIELQTFCYGTFEE